MTRIFSGRILLPFQLKQRGIVVHKFSMLSQSPRTVGLGKPDVLDSMFELPSKAVLHFRIISLHDIVAAEVVGPAAEEDGTNGMTCCLLRDMGTGTKH